MTYLLDSNACIHILRHPRGIVAEKFFATPASDMAASIMTKAELLVGPYRRKSPPTEYAKVKQIIEKIRILPFEESCVDHFAKIAAHLLDVGRPGDAIDIQIAATAQHHDLTVVTHNTRHFENIPGLRLEDWQLPAN